MNVFGMTREKAFSFAEYNKVPWRSPIERDYKTISRRIFTRDFETRLVASWTGKVLIIPEHRNGEMICHEVCHWLVAPESRRNRREFGLGGSPYHDVWPSKERRRSRPARHRVREMHYEIHTCVLEIFLFKTLNLHWRNLAKELNFSGYYGNFDSLLTHKDNVSSVRFLESRGLFDKVANWASEVGVAPTSPPSRAVGF